MNDCGGARVVTMELIQVVLERVMDEDMPYAMCAAGCLGNFILFGDYNNSDGGGGVNGWNSMNGFQLNLEFESLLLII